MWVSQPQDSNKKAQPPNVIKARKRNDTAKCNDTEPSKFLWKLKEKKEYFTMSWKSKNQSIFKSQQQTMSFMSRREISYCIESSNSDAEHAQRTGFNLYTPKKVHS